MIEAAFGNFEEGFQSSEATTAREWKDQVVLPIHPLEMRKRDITIPVEEFELCEACLCRCFVHEEGLPYLTTAV